jgi:hypothetical protein
MGTRLFAFAIALTLTAASAAQSDETALFDSTGTPVAYIADDLTIYLWSGKPVAYLYRGNHGTDVYGFNGKHLGWFEKGYVRDDDGNPTCGLKSVIRSPKLEPLKSLKELKPLKSLRELPPLKPISSLDWADTPCQIALALGADD